jgi:guanylate kinase
MLIARSISMTTRAPRPGEIEDTDYYFVTRPRFEASLEQGELLEWAEVHGNLYGTPVWPNQALVDSGFCIILVIDVQGAMKVREQVPNSVLIFVHAPDREALEARLRARGTDDEATIQKRLSNARGEVALADRYDYQIVNDDLDKAVDQLAAILLENHCGG